MEDVLLFIYVNFELLFISLNLVRVYEEVLVKHSFKLLSQALGFG